MAEEEIKMKRIEPLAPLPITNITPEIEEELTRFFSSELGDAIDEAIKSLEEIMKEEAETDSAGNCTSTSNSVGKSNGA